MRRALGSLLMLPLLLGQVTAPSSRSAPATTQVAPDLYALSADDFFKRPDVKRKIEKERVDIPLLEAAIFHQSNRQRAANKLALFKRGVAMQLMARNHSLEMVKLQFFEHESPTPANRTLTDRLKNVGLVNVTAGENIAVLPAKEMGSGSYRVYDNPDGTERWVDEATGKVIDYYTYEQLAVAVVDQWMNSPPHRQNLLDKRFLYLGVGTARGPYEDKKQDSFYMTQNFCATVTPASETRAAAQLNPVAGRGR